MNEIKIKTEYIKLSQLLKLGNIVTQGSEAKMLIAQGEVKIDGVVAFERGKKIYGNSIVEVKGYDPIEVKV